MVSGLEPVVVFWIGWGIHFMVLLSFMVQVTLLLLADIRRRKDWAWLKVVIWSAYMLADTAAIYALGHMSVVCRSPEHQLMALWAPLLLVHLGGQDNITAYAIEDNRLWLRHLQTLVVQVAAAAYVLYVSNILFHPMSSKVSVAAMLMFVVGVIKYAERIWALMRADSCASSILSATSYAGNVVVSRPAVGEPRRWLSDDKFSQDDWDAEHLIVAHSLLDVPKQMFVGPTTYVQVQINDKARYQKLHKLRLAELQLSMMYDLLYTKGAGGHKRSVDVWVTSVLLFGAVFLEIMSVVRAVFSRWTVLLLYGKKWDTMGNMIFSVIAVVNRAMERPARPGSRWLGLGRMRQHSLFKLASHSDYSRGSKMAKRMGAQDWWDSNAYSWSTEVPPAFIEDLLQLLVARAGQDITKSEGWNALQQQRHYYHRGCTLNIIEELSSTCNLEGFELEERILVLHIATHAYIQWSVIYGANERRLGRRQAAAEVLANYMFFLLAARPNMLPYPVSRQTYVQLRSDAVTHLRHCTKQTLHKAILKQKEALLQGTSLQPDEDEGIVGGETAAAAAQPPPQPSSMNKTLDRGCQVAAKLMDYTETTSRSCQPVVEALVEIWVEMLCYTAYWCNENSHAKHLTDGGEIMSAITLLMIYTKNGLIHA